MVIRGFWYIANLILLVAIVSITSGDGTVLGRYSEPYAFGVVMSVGVVILATFLTFTQRGQRLMGHASACFNALMQRYRLKFAAGLALLVLIPLVLLFSFPANIQSLQVLLLFNVIMLLVSVVSHPAHTSTAQDTAVDRLLWLLLAAVLVVSFFSAHAVPVEAGDGDEIAWTNIAVTWNTTGQAYLKFSGQAALPITPGNGWWVAPYGAWLQVFGVSLSSGRMFSWLVYIASIACIGWAGSRLYDRTTGLIAAFFTAVSPFMLTARIIRPEIGIAAVGALLLILYLAGQRRPWWAFAAGWLAILTLEIHAAGLAYIVALLVVYGLDMLARMRDRRNPFTPQIFALIAGMGVGTIIYLVLHVLVQPEPGSYLSYMRSTRGFLDSAGMIQGLAVALIYISRDGLLEVLLTIIAVAALFTRATPHDRLVLRFFAAVLVSYFVLVPESQTYIVILMPFFAWASASLISLGFRAVSTPPRPALSLVAIAAFSAPFFAQSLPHMSLNPMPPAEITPVMQRVRELSSPDEVVAGDVFTWWGLTDYPEFYNTWAEYELSRGLDYATGEALWAGLNPALVFSVGGRDFPALWPGLRAWLDEGNFVLVDSFEWEGHLVEFWRRPVFGDR